MDSLFSTHTPAFPPTTEDDRLAWLRLIRSYRVGPTTFARLLAEHGSAQNALAALPGIAAAAGVSDYSPCTVEQALISELQPAKINLAALGNVVPHLHWHVIARFEADSRFPHPIWAAPQREQPAPERLLRVGLGELDERVKAALQRVFQCA